MPVQRNTYKFPILNPLLHSALRLKIMVALDSLESAEFMYLCQIYDCSRGNLSAQMTILKEAGYLKVSKSGLGNNSRTVMRITTKGHDALHDYEQTLHRLFTDEIPPRANTA